MEGYDNNEWQTLLTNIKGDKKSLKKSKKKSENVFEQGKCMIDLNY